jgi:chromosome partitioning protein
LAASNYFLIPVIPDVMSSRGVTHFRNLVAGIDRKLEFWRTGAAIPAADVPKSYVPRVELAAIVPYMAKHAGRAESGFTNVHTEQLAALRRMWGDELVNTVVKHMTGVSEAMDFGWPIWNLKATQNIKKVAPELRNVCIEIETRISG